MTLYWFQLCSKVVIISLSNRPKAERIGNSLIPTVITNTSTYSIQCVQMTVTPYLLSQSASNMQMTFLDSSLILFWPIKKKSIIACSFLLFPKGLRNKENAHQLPCNTNPICHHPYITLNSDLIYNQHTIIIKKGIVHTLFQLVMSSVSQTETVSKNFTHGCPTDYSPLELLEPLLP